jgi:hypothetical protein
LRGTDDPSRDDDVILIAQALKRNTNLEMSCLYNNNLTSIGVKALLTCVFDSSSLNAISESNHTLQRLWIFLDQEEPIMLHLNWVQKIILAMQDKDTFLQYLANVLVELIPEMLAFPRWNVPRHKHLHILYSIALVEYAYALLVLFLVKPNKNRNRVLDIRYIWGEAKFAAKEYSAMSKCTRAQQDYYLDHLD